MIHCKCNFYSKYLKYYTDIEILLPSASAKDSRAMNIEEIYPEDPLFPLLILLHGAYGDSHSWLRNTDIFDLSQAHGIAVAMPCGHNSFYCDAESGEQFFSYVSKELPALMRSAFPISKKRSETFIAGASMGGYGSALIALNNPDSYAAFASFSGAFIPHLISSRLQDIGINDLRFDLLFGAEDNFRGGRHDLFHLLETFPSGVEKPNAYIYCGCDDSINIDMNIEFIELLRKRNFFCKREIIPGDHEWKLWNDCLGKFMLEIKTTKSQDKL